MAVPLMPFFMTKWQRAEAWKVSILMERHDQVGFFSPQNII